MSALLCALLISQTPWMAEGVVKEVTGPGRAQAELRTDDGHRVVLVPRGRLGKKELTALSSHRVRVWGERGDPEAPGGNYAKVDNYEILDVGKGQKPMVGTLATIVLSGQKRLIFVDDANGVAHLLPTGWGKKMSSRVGSKLWMIGRGEQERFRPTRFGILRAGPLAKGAE